MKDNYTMQIPTSINPCPIVDALLEIRFSTQIPQGAVFGIVYNKLKDDFSKVTELPILQLPGQIRENDPNFAFQPLYKISDGQFSIQIGPKVITISSPIDYIGWSRFSDKIFSILNKVKTIEFVKNVHRLGLRYINFFEFDIFHKIKLDIRLGNEELKTNNNILRFELGESGYKNTLQISNKANYNKKGKIIKGSLIDIDTFNVYKGTDFFSNMKKNINGAKESENQIFFKLLKEDFLETLNPVYK